MLQVVSGVVSVPKLSRLFITAEFFGEWGGVLPVTLRRDFIVAPRNSNERPKGLIHRFGIVEYLGYVGRKDDDIASRLEPFHVFAAHAAAEIVFSQHAVVGFRS